MLERWTPAFRNRVAQNTKIIHDLLRPRILSRLDETTVHTDAKTVVNLAMKEVKDNKQELSPEFIESVLANLKIFLFAGHDTTAQTLYVVPLLYW